jgi:flagellar basal-body rod protein FlgB
MSINLVAAIAGKALDGLFARQSATAHNVANANSENFTPVRVSFEDALREAAAVRPGDTPEMRLARVAAVRPEIGAPLPIDGNPVKLDQEIATATETSTHYAMLIGMLDRSLQIEQLAVKGA